MCSMFTIFLSLLLIAVSLQCCSASSHSFLVLNDLHYDPTYFDRHESCQDNAVNERGPYGHYDCDAPWSLIEYSVRTMASKVPSPDFIVWAGDNTHHALDKSNTILTPETAVEMIKNITDLINLHFPNVRVLPMIGNHDYIPKNQIPAGQNYIFGEFLKMWKTLGWLTNAEETTFKAGGYYSVNVAGDFRAVILNDNFYLPSNKETEGDDDPGGQFAWLETTLTEARQQTEKVFLFMHVPLGYKEYDPNEIGVRQDQNDKLIELIREYSDIIVGVYSVHEHTDTFKVIYDADKKPINFIMLPPSITPWRWFGGSSTGRNPAFRTIHYETTSSTITDIDQYYMVLPKKGDTQIPEWKLLYRFQDAYDVQSITPKTLHELVQKFKKADSEEFEKYHRYNTVLASKDVYVPCPSTTSCDCKKKYICSMEEVQKTGYDACMKDLSLTCGTRVITSSVTAIIILVLCSALLK